MKSAGKAGRPRADDQNIRFELFALHGHNDDSILADGD
jgi:hypothetical protein